MRGGLRKIKRQGRGRRGRVRERKDSGEGGLYPQGRPHDSDIGHCLAVTELRARATDSHPYGGGRSWVRWTDDPFRQPSRGRSAAATPKTPEGGGKGVDSDSPWGDCS